MKSIRILGIALTSTILLGSLSACGGGGKTLVKVGSEKITEGDLDLLVRVNPRLKPRLDTPAGKQKILENYVEQDLLYLESKKRGLENSPQVKDKVDLYKKIIVAQALLDDELDQKVKEYYNNHKDEFNRLKVSQIQILVAPEGSKKGHSDAEALKIVEEIRGRLAKGEDFAVIAKELSEDDKTKNTGGDLGYITINDKRLERDGMLPIAEKAFAMKEGDYSEAIKTKNGYEVIKVTEGKKTMPLEEADAAIRFRLQSDIRTQLLDDLKKKYKVEFLTSAETLAKAPSSAPAEAPIVAPQAPVNAPMPTEPAAEPAKKP